MTDKKKKWTVIDTVIVILVIITAFAGLKMFGGKIGSGEKTSITAQILMSNKDAELGEAIKSAIGQDVTLSLTEKDSGVIKDVSIAPASIMVYNSMEGAYRMQTLEETIDIIATVEIEVEEDDYAFTAGSTYIKVGNSTPFRGKGYATEGTVIVIDKEAQ